MSTLERQSGITVHLPPGAVVDVGTERSRWDRSIDFSQPIMLDEKLDPVWEELNVTLAGVGFDLVDSVEFTPEAASAGDRAAGIWDGPVPTGEARISMDVPVDDGEEAVLLVSQGGVLRWVLPRRGDEAGEQPEKGRRLIIEPLVPADAGATVSRGLISDWLTDRLKTYVFRFAARTIAGLPLDAAVRLLEEGVRVGPVVIDSTDVTHWRPVETLEDRAVPGHVRRVLLLIHGTFSSTVGSFCGLGAGRGRAVLEEWLHAYDLVLGFDHRSLSEDPRQNAEQILAALNTRRLEQGFDLDIVCYSRGGLVARTLVERLLPVLLPKCRVGRVAYVATTNNGTLLARQENWEELLNLITTLSGATCHVMRLLPGAMPSAEILDSTISGVAILVQALTSAALGEGRVPGLAAMEPDGEFIAALNDPANEPVGGKETLHLAVTSNFEPSRLSDLDHGLTGLSTHFARVVADGLVDTLFQGADNDLVVDTASTLTLHPALGEFADTLCLRDNPRVHHLNYFLEGQTVGWMRAVMTDFEDMEMEPIGFRGPVRGGGGLELHSGDGGTYRGGGEKDPVDLHVEAITPGSVEPDQVFKTRVTLQRDAFDHPAPDHGGRGEVVVDPVKQITLEVMPRGCLAPAGRTEVSIPVPEDDPVAYSFKIKGLESGTGEVWVMVSQEGRRLLKLDLEVTVVEGAQDEEPVSAAGSPEPVYARPADKQLNVRLRRRDDGHDLEYELRAPALGLYKRYDPLTIHGDIQEHMDAKFLRVEESWKENSDTPDNFQDWLESLGMELSEELFPMELRRDLWKHRDGLDGLEVVTDEPFIPWEMCYLFDPDDSVEEGARFMAELGMVRAIWGPGRPDHIPVRHGRAFTVVPRYPGRLNLPAALAEERWLKRTLGTEPVACQPPDRTQGLRQRAREGQTVDMLHFAGHGDADDKEIYLVMGGETLPDNSFKAKMLPSVTLKRARWQNSEGEKPLVFLNACRTGRRLFLLRGERSWARTFLDRGAGAFVAPLWSVGDFSASRFSTHFYQALKEGEPFSQATKTAREKARQDGDPTWLAYTVFASPHGRVTFS